MPKRSSVILLSSDEEDANTNTNTNTTRTRSKSRASSSVPRSPKKPRSSAASRSAPPKDQRGFNQFKSLYEDFSEDFAEFKVSAGLRNICGMEPWLEKYRPRTVEELAVHKKKVEEVRVWLEDRLRVSKQRQLDSHALLITGPAGVGKSATIQVLASHFGAELFEWDTPTPTIWQEHVHNYNSGIRYISKLDEFENFVERVRKFGLLPSSASLSTVASVILLIEDLPVVNGKIAYRRLLKCLQLLSKSVQIPTVIVVTDYGGAESGDNNSHSSEELWLSVKNTGACKVAFNPVTANSIKKVLSRICRQEQCNTTSEEIDFFANASDGDIRNAIQSLQYLCLNPRPKKNTFFSSIHTTISSEGKTGSVKASECSSLSFGRDQTLSLFHALGKFLHNKRNAENIAVQGQPKVSVREELSRLPLKMDAPEKVLCQAYGQARPVAEFVHENVLDFIGEEAIEDAWVVASYLSDVDCLLSSPNQMLGANYRAENITQSVAASVAVRGVLFGNAHSSLPRWHTVRRPKLWQVEQSVRHDNHEIERLRSEVHGLGISSLSVISTEYRPMLQWLRHQATSSCSLPGNASDSEQGHCESTDDEIEDC